MLPQFLAALSLSFMSLTAGPAPEPSVAFPTPVPASDIEILCDDDLSGAPLGAVLVVDLVAVDEHDQVRILLDAPRLTQIGQQGALALALFELAVEL